MSYYTDQMIKAHRKAQDDYDAQSGGKSLGEAVADAMIADGVRNPLNSQFQDGEIYRARREAEKYLDSPVVPPGDYVSTVVAATEQAGLARGDSHPETIAEWNAKLQVLRDGEEAYRIRDLLNRF